ncbi:F-box family protein [Thalictrum thalictroides]|uniref:F-box family protein n=2 Tax=Thalictrum thalictroides TaxID=46969 RepID=A0A7J6WYX0_THATH|nr:F-box family protein [Thalictrum thalictroides]
MPSFNTISIIGSCNGLVCLSNDKSYVLVWNPSTREYAFVSPGYCGDGTKNNEHSTAVMGFGYDSVTEDYKLVKIEYFYDAYGFGSMTEFDRCEVRVYTLGTNSWRLIDDTPSPPCYIGNLTRVAHVNGVLYWVGLRGIGIELSKSIISFNLRTEKFGEVSWPEFEDHSYRDLGLGVLQGCLCVFSYHLERVDIWVTKDYDMEESWSWTRQFSIARSTKYLEPLVLQKNGEILLQMGFRSLLVYDPLNETVQVPHVRGIPDRFRTSTYVESLTSVASLMGMVGNSVAARISQGKNSEVDDNI